MQPRYEELEERIREFEYTELTLKESDARLRESEERYRMITKATSDYVYSVTIYSNHISMIDWVSGAFTDITGYTPNEINSLPNGWLSITDQDDIKNLLKSENVSERLHKKNWESEYRITTKQGDIRWLHDRILITEELENGAMRGVGGVRDITDRMRVEKALRESEERYRTVVETVNEDIILQEASGKILTWNKGAENIFGVTADEAIGQTSEGKDWPTIHDDGSKFEGKDHPSMVTLKTGKPCNDVNMGVRQIDNSIKWIQINTRPIFKKDSEKPNAVVITFVDITERKNIEKKLQHKQKMLSRTERISQIGSWEWKIEDDSVIWSEELFRIFHMEPSPEAPNWAQHSKLNHPDDFGRLRQAVEKAISYKKPYEEELRAIRKDGEIRICVARGFPETDKAGKVYRLYGSLEDITERNQTEMALHESESKFRNLFENSVAPILNTFSDGTIEDANPACEDLFGVGRNGLEGANILDFYANPADRMKFKRIMDEKGSVKDYPIPFKKKDGTLLHCLASVSVHRPEDGRESVGYRGTLRDVTREQKLQKQLTQTQKMEAIGTLAGGIAHDFSNMLGVIMGNVSYVLNRFKNNDVLSEALMDVQESVRQGTNLTRQLITFAKGGTPIKKVIGLTSLIKDTVQLVLRGSNSNCQFKLIEDLWMVEADEGQLNQAFSNLIINADQAMSEGGIIQISSENTIVDETSPFFPLNVGSYVTIKITDQGIGIPEKHLSKIFDPFFTTKQKGNGLGLATTFSIIQNHGGHILAESTLGEGTTFTSFLPATENALNHIDEKEKIVHKGKGKILIMDDQEDLLKMAQRLLGEMGYETIFATDGLKAIEIYREAFQNVVLVILDLTVPGGMGGVKTIPELLKINPDAKVVVSSGYSNDPVMSDCQSYGFCGVLEKPYSTDQMAELLNNIIGEKGHSRQAKDFLL